MTHIYGAYEHNSAVHLTTFTMLFVYHIYHILYFLRLSLH
jgi:hypothetical protein